jgi:hypothetical protein
MSFDYQDDASTDHENECPFAVDDSAPQHETICPSSPTVYMFKNKDLSSPCTPPPALTASFISNGSRSTLDTSATQSELASSSLSQANSHFLDAAASLLDPNSSLLVGGSSFLPSYNRAIPWSDTTTSTFSEHQPAFSEHRPATEQSVAFSQLLQEADDTQARPPPPRLPVLPEEASLGSMNRFSQKSDHFFSFHDASESIIPACSPTESLHRSESRRMASLAGATASRTGETSFQVSVDIATTCSIQDVMDIVGNPDLLKMWCDPVPDLVITRSSEGARTEANRQQPQSDREYEGEWVEATTAQLVAPPNTSCVYRTSRGVSSLLGFPTYGRITMFVERQRGQVGLTIGPFPGNMEVLHKIRIQQLANRKIRIVDDARIQRDMGEPEVSLCGLMEVVERCLLPAVDDYMDQVLSSMARLRFLVENGETSMYNADSSSCFMMGETTLSTPLLSVN